MHIRVADTNIPRAVRIADLMRALHSDYEVTVVADVPFSSAIEQGEPIGTIAVIDNRLPDWDVVSGYAPGTLGYVLHNCLLGSAHSKSGPVLLYGHLDRNKISRTSRDLFGCDYLAMPGVKYVIVPSNSENEVQLMIVQEFELVRKDWEIIRRKGRNRIYDSLARAEAGMEMQWIVLARNLFLARGLLRALRNSIRPVVHSLNAIQDHQAPFDLGDIEYLAIYADRLLQYSNGTAFPGAFQGVVQAWKQEHGDLISRTKDLGEQLKEGEESYEALAREQEELQQEIFVPLFALSALITWWEALLKWAGLAAAVHAGQALEVVISDDQPLFRDALKATLKLDGESELRGGIARFLSRKWRVHITDIQNLKESDETRRGESDKPEDVVWGIRERGLHEVERLTGSPVVVFQDLIFGNDPNFGLHAIRRLRSRYPWIRIIAVTARESARFELLDAGADLYLAKSRLKSHTRDADQLLTPEEVAIALKNVLCPGTVLSIGIPHVNTEIFQLLFTQYGLNPSVIPVDERSLDEILLCLPHEAGPPRLLLIGWEQEVDRTILMRRVMVVRRLCMLFPEMAIFLWAPQDASAEGDAAVISQHWFELWSKWIPNYMLRVLPIGRSVDHQIIPIVKADENGGNGHHLGLLFTADELEAADFLLHRSLSLPELASYNFIIPRRKTPEGATGSQVAPTEAETRAADKIAAHFGGSSVHILHGRWIGEKGIAEYDTSAAIEAFAPINRANRAFALDVTEEIRTELGEESVLQIERPISAISREGIQQLPYLSAALCDSAGAIDGGQLLQEVHNPYPHNKEFPEAKE